MAATSRIASALAVIVALAAAAPALAQPAEEKRYEALIAATGLESIEQEMLSAATTLTAAAAAMPVPDVRPAPVQRRAGAGARPAMYVSFGTLQALDAHSTLRAIDAGGVELNPLMRWSTAHPVAFVSMKGAATAATIYAAEKIAKKHPRRAMVFMAAVNAAYAAIVFRNYKAASPYLN